tara:strand:+ start:2180 stop:2494 length:315 start_codon:yes stop_codon:yes gene_type:complete
MGFNINSEEGEIPPEMSELVNDIDKQVEFHKQNILNSQPVVVEEVMKTLMVTIVENLDEDTAGGLLPMITAFAESLIELKIEVEYLKGEMIEKKSPPPISFEEN